MDSRAENTATAQQYDVAVIGGGISGLTTAARLQAQGLTTIVLESHRRPGGCAGYFCRRGFSFDVGATTLVDFEPGGIGGTMLTEIGAPEVKGERLPGYVAWLPNRRITLYRERELWEAERLQALGASRQHQRFWSLMDNLADVFWRASRRGIKLPVQNTRDVINAIRCIGLGGLSLARYWNWTMGDALRKHALSDDEPLVGLLSMLLEDTVHNTVDKAPLINGALGITIRGAGLTRPTGGMRGFLRCFVRHYRHLGGKLLLRARVSRVRGQLDEFQVESNRGSVFARQVVSALPTPLTAKLAPAAIGSALQPYVRRDAGSFGGAFVVFLGVPEDEVATQTWTHHKLLYDYSRRLGNGNNMFISVSAPGDFESAPSGYRTVMISTHCELEPWENLSSQEYRTLKQQLADHLLDVARKVYPSLGRRALVFEAGGPPTYERFTLRPRGAVGGLQLKLQNSNQAAVPHDIGIPGFWLAGDTTWPGLGTVACTLGSSIVAKQVLQLAKPKGSHVVTRPDEGIDAHSQPAVRPCVA